MEKTITKWEDCLREDLNLINVAVEKGWTPEFSYTDIRNGRNVPENCPHDAVAFRKGNKVAWLCYPNGEEVWRVADLIDSHYRNHRDYESLAVVFEKE